MRLRSTPLPLAAAARATRAVRGGGGYRGHCAAIGGAVTSYPGGTSPPWKNQRISAPTARSTALLMLSMPMPRLPDLPGMRMMAGVSSSL